jgi:hypothetical protein
MTNNEQSSLDTFVNTLREEQNTDIEEQRKQTPIETNDNLDTKELIKSLQDEVEFTTNEKKIFYITKVLEARRDELKYSKNASSLSWVGSDEKKARINNINNVLDEINSLNENKNNFLQSLISVFDNL